MVAALNGCPFSGVALRIGNGRRGLKAAISEGGAQLYFGVVADLARPEKFELPTLKFVV